MGRRGRVCDRTPESSWGPLLVWPKPQGGHMPSPLGHHTLTGTAFSCQGHLGLWTPARLHLSGCPGVPPFLCPCCPFTTHPREPWRFRLPDLPWGGGAQSSRSAWSCHSASSRSCSASVPLLTLTTAPPARSPHCRIALRDFSTEGEEGNDPWSEGRGTVHQTYQK